MVDSWLSFRDDEVNVVLRLALFVVFAGTNLSALLGLAIGVLEAPVSVLEVATR